MTTSSLLLGIVPLLIFVIVDSFAGLKKALIFTVLMAIAEAIFTLVYFKGIDFVSIICLVSVLAFCWISYSKKNALFIKLQPVFLSSILGIILLFSYALDRALLLEFSLKYKEFLPAQFQGMLEITKFRELLIFSTMTLGVSHFFHAILVYWSAIKLNNWYWLIMRGVGYYLFMFLGIFSAKLFL